MGEQYYKPLSEWRTMPSRMKGSVFASISNISQISLFADMEYAAIDLSPKSFLLER